MIGEPIGYDRLKSAAHGRSPDRGPLPLVGRRDVRRAVRAVVGDDVRRAVRAVVDDVIVDLIEFAVIGDRVPDE